jgi:hypothetical protein
VVCRGRNVARVIEHEPSRLRILDHDGLQMGSSPSQSDPRCGEALMAPAHILVYVCLQDFPYIIHLTIANLRTLDTAWDQDANPAGQVTGGYQLVA